MWQIVVILIILHCIKLHAGNEFLCWFTATFDAGRKCLLVSLIEVIFFGNVDDFSGKQMGRNGVIGLLNRAIFITKAQGLTFLLLLLLLEHIQFFIFVIDLKGRDLC